jgi:hypothetical protein
MWNTPAILRKLFNRKALVVHIMQVMYEFSNFFCREPFGNLLEFTMIQENYPKASETLCFTLQIAGKRLMSYSLPLSTYGART